MSLANVNPEVLERAKLADRTGQGIGCFVYFRIGPLGERIPGTTFHRVTREMAMFGARQQVFLTGVSVGVAEVIPVCGCRDGSLQVGPVEMIWADGKGGL